MKYLLSLGALVGVASAQAGAWAQCGGSSDWNGPTTCISGYTCIYSNPWYSQCLPGSGPAPSPTTLVTKTTTTTASTTTSTVKPTTTSTPPPTSNLGWKWFGANEAGGEFGEKVLPGTWGTEFIFPNPATITTLRGQGYNTFRVQLKMERLTPGSLTSGFNNAYLQNLTNVVNHITQSGGWAVLDPHNYGRFNNAVITDVAGFQTWWVNFANQFKGNDRVVFDTNNEYHTMDQTLVLNLNQAAINGIRATGATQYIFVEGNQWSGAWSWPAVNDNMKALTDPLNKIVYEMHQYLDSDSSGTSPSCVSTTIGVERVQAATAWLRQNGKVGILGEFAGGANPQCQTAVKGLLDYLKANSDVWSGALWWSAGPWWSDYIFSFEPPSGTGYQYYNSLLKGYLA
ncbi:cellulase [Colletotrichum higginsianum]|uniref:cellulase n=2 Tax=Colletotrichum higginsianum TaxID=80884 RepID=H1VJM3_COLHI|nr:Cellulase [Colletotrichum higginsianum IMI 349063]OBR09746.1 Cellulase [Colletotrichum higginsianum IMI 349063]TID07162.1 Endoglucanase gh5-1 [Colletotrichum higginsianum]CCF40426.1 cellulase [Colletotrichum higginsianum]